MENILKCYFEPIQYLNIHITARISVLKCITITKTSKIIRFLNRMLILSLSAIENRQYWHNRQYPQNHCCRQTYTRNNF